MIAQIVPRLLRAPRGAAYLGFPPTQLRLGNAYEHPTPPFGYDPLMSVQYYSLASQAGEPEADMAFSK